MNNNLIEVGEFDLDNVPGIQLFSCILIIYNLHHEYAMIMWLIVVILKSLIKDFR